MAGLSGVYLRVVPTGDADADDPDRRAGTAGTHRTAVSSGHDVIAVLGSWHVSGGHGHVRHHHARHRHRQARGPVYHGKGVHPGRADRLIALAAGHVCRTRAGQRPRLVGGRHPAGGDLRPVLRNRLHGGTRQLQPDPAHRADAVRRRHDAGHHGDHLRDEQSELRLHEYAVLRHRGAGGVLHPHPGGPVRLRDSVRAAGAGAAARLQPGAGVHRRAAEKPAPGIPAIQGEHRIHRTARARSQTPDRGPTRGGGPRACGGRLRAA